MTASQTLYFVHLGCIAHANCRAVGIREPTGLSYHRRRKDTTVR